MISTGGSQETVDFAEHDCSEGGPRQLRKEEVICIMNGDIGLRRRQITVIVKHIRVCGYVSMGFQIMAAEGMNSLNAIAVNIKYYRR